MTISLESFKKAVAVDLIPVLNNFVIGLRSVGDEAKEIDRGNTLVWFARHASEALAALVDVASLVLKSIRALAGTLDEVLAAGEVAVAWSKSLFDDSGNANLEAALARRNKVADEARQRWVDIWNGSKTAYYDAVKGINDVSRSTGGASLLAGNPFAPQKPKADYNPVSDKADANAKKLETQINQVEKYRIAQEGVLQSRQAELESVSMSALEYKNLADARALDLKNQELSVGLLPDAKAKLDAVTAALKEQTLAFNEREAATKKSAAYGAQSFLKGYLDDVTDVGKQTKKVMEDAFKGTEDALVNFVTTGKLSFKDLADSIIKDLVRMAIKQSIMAPLANLMGGLTGGLFGGGSFSATDYATRAANASPGMFGPGFGVVPSALGNVFSGGALQPFAAGGIVTRPTLFPMARGAGLMGEAGPEAIMPLRRGADGKLGVAGAGGSTVVNVNVNDQNNSNVSVQQSRGSDGSMNIDVMIEAAVSRSIAKNGGIAQALQNRYGLNRAGGR
jgi:lambda family phage tail tape measure protein